MNKIVLKNCDVREFSLLIKKSASLDNFIFINLRGNEFESTAYNKNKSALKSITADLTKYCDEFVNELGDNLVKIQFTNAGKLISVLGLVGTEGVNVTFYIEENGYAKKVVVENTEVNLTVPAADKEALSFLEIPEHARHNIFEDTSTLEYKVGISENEFKYLSQLFQLNKESCRVCFSISNDVVLVSEIESTDENVRDVVNGFLDDGKILEFDAFEKLYAKKLTYDAFERHSDDGYLKCFNKSYFVWIDSDEHYDIEFHSNKIKFISVDEKGTKTYVVLTPVRFA
jgi:deoxyadenosine/deoxycytidine kinase